MGFDIKVVLTDTVVEELCSGEKETVKAALIRLGIDPQRNPEFNDLLDELVSNWHDCDKLNAAVTLASKASVTQPTAFYP